MHDLKFQQINKTYMPDSSKMATIKLGFKYRVAWFSTETEA